MRDRLAAGCAGVLLLLVSALAPAQAESGKALAYLEGLKGGPDRYIAPSEIDPRYTIALYVNASPSGPMRQRMWVLQRESVGGPWRLALWDKRYWKKPKNKKRLQGAETPPYSWLVSTGRKWRGDKFSGPTPTGVYSLDERRGRSQFGWHARGMVHAVYIDYHYRSGRRSGVAFHGTTIGQYRKLGRIASHGCIRMRQENALALLRRLRGKDGVLEKALRWGTVPRFWKTGNTYRRYGYLRDGRTHARRTAEVDSLDPTPAEVLSDTSPFADVLTKVGYRAIAVIFRDSGAR